MKSYFYEKTGYTSYSNSSNSCQTYRYEFNSNKDIIFILYEDDNICGVDYYYYDNGSITLIRNSNEFPDGHAYYRNFSYEVFSSTIYEWSFYPEAYFATPEKIRYYQNYSDGSIVKFDSLQIAKVNTNILCFENADDVLKYYQDGDMSVLINMGTDARIQFSDKTDMDISHNINIYNATPFSDTSISDKNLYDYHTKNIQDGYYGEASKRLALYYPKIKSGMAYTLNDWERTILYVENMNNDYTVSIDPYVYSDTEPDISTIDVTNQFIWQQEYE